MRMGPGTGPAGHNPRNTARKCMREHSMTAHYTNGLSRHFFRAVDCDDCCEENQPRQAIGLPL
jgi:hypothetical protein